VAAISASLKKRDLEDGDVVVVPDKPFAIAQNRLIPLDWLLTADPKKTSAEGRERLLEQVRSRVSTPVEASDLILADTYIDSELGSLATVGAYDHNRIAADVAAGIRASTGKIIDTVISDTDTGLDVSEQLIGCITICATPLGATRGLTIYEAMRAACAAEFTRGSTRRIPIVICKPIPRSRLRQHIGDFRGYNGRLQLAREGNVAFA
jgi:F420-0:gamma-glutamyl ligase-like protein